MDFSSLVKILIGMSVWEAMIVGMTLSLVVLVVLRVKLDLRIRGLMRIFL
jgi:hypothetical protein